LRAVGPVQFGQLLHAEGEFEEGLADLCVQVAEHFGILGYLQVFEEVFDSGLLEVAEHVEIHLRNYALLP
jgi:hypothetical protein